MSVATLPRTVTRGVVARLAGAASPLPAARPAADRRRRARRTLAGGLLVFVAAQVGLNAAVETGVSAVRDPLYFDKFALLRANRPAFFAPDGPSRVLFVGSSRTQNAVNAGQLETDLSARLGRDVTGFNFGVAGCGPVTNAVYLRRLVDAGVRAEFVVIEVHPAFLAGQPNPVPVERRWLDPVRFRPDELAFARGVGLPLETPRTHSPRVWLTAAYEYRLSILNRYGGPLTVAPRWNVGHDPDGWGFARLKDATPAERVRNEVSSREQYREYFDGYRPTGPGVGGVRDQLATARRAGMKAALLVTPETAAFRSWYDPVGRKQFDALLPELAAEWGVPVWDTRTWLTDDSSRDGHHLNGAGADAFTAKLAADLLAPWTARPEARTP